jgi:hypothetical protein
MSRYYPAPLASASGVFLRLRAAPAREARPPPEGRHPAKPDLSN